LKYQRFVPSGCKAIGIRRFEFAAKTQILCMNIIFFIPLWAKLCMRLQQFTSSLLY